MKILFKMVLWLTLCASAFGTTVTPIVLDPNVPPEFSIVAFPDESDRMAVGADGLIRVVTQHQVGSTKSYRLIRCLNEDCSLSVVTTLTGSFTSPTIGFANGQIAMSLAPDDTPRIAVIGSGNTTDGNLGYIKCNDVDCVSSTWVSLGYQANALATSIATDSTGLSYITYGRVVLHSGLESYRIATCSGVSCTPSVYTVVPDEGTTGVALLYSGHLRIASDDTPRLVYARCATITVELCNIHYWTTGSDVIIGTDNNGQGLSGLALGVDDNANIAWATFDQAGVDFTHCTNSTCSSRTATTEYLVTQDNAQSATTTVAIGADGFSRIAISYAGPLQPLPGGTTVVTCTNQSCSTNTTNIISLPSSMFMYRQLSEIRMTSVAGVPTESIYGEQTDSSAINLGAVLLQIPESTTDFTISATPDVQVVLPPVTVDYTITIAPVHGFTGDVALTATGLPPGVFAVIAPSTVTGGTGTADMTVTSTIGIPKGGYPITITGVSNSLTHSAIVDLDIIAQKPRFVSRKSIDLLGDNPGLDVAVRNKSGKIPFAYSLIENPIAFTFQNQWVINTQMVGVSSPPLAYYAPQYLPAPKAGEPAVVPLPAYIQPIIDTVVATPSAITVGTDATNQGWYFIDSAFISHFFDVSGVSGNALLTDGSGYTLSASGSPSVLCQTAPCPTVVDTSGNVIASNNNVDPTFRGNVGAFTDPDNVRLTAYAVGDPAQTVIYVDTMGQTVLNASETNATSVPPNGALPTNVYTYVSPSGVQKFVVSYALFYQSTNFGCDGISEMPRTPVYLPVRVSLPDGSFYLIAYEPTPGGAGDVTGRIASVVMPMGGRNVYQYGGVNNGMNCADGSVPVLTVKTPDGGVYTYIHTLN